MDSTVSHVYTYHCLCNHLVLASTTPLSQLTRRAASSSLDKAYILPLAADPTPSHYAYLASAVPVKAPRVIQGQNGFEKRYFYRCGRCGVVVGYRLDWMQYEGQERSGPRDDVVYLLPGALLSTEDMRQGRNGETSIELRATA